MTFMLDRAIHFGCYVRQAISEPPVTKFPRVTAMNRKIGLPLRSLALLLAAAIAPAHEPGHPAARSTDGDSVQFLTWTYRDAPMGLYLPVRPQKPLPVVMFLHGCHNDPVHEWHWINAALNAIEPTAVFLPTAPTTPNTQYPCADWGGTYDADLRPQMTNALHELDSLIRANQFDSSRQYLYGESMGGEGVYRLLVDFPTRFQGAVTVGGYSANKGAAQMALTPLWILIGADDEMSPIADTRAIHQAILDAGGTRAKLTELPGLGHVQAIEQVRTDSNVVSWLLRQSRASSAIEPCKPLSHLASQPFTLRNGILRMSDALPAGTRLSLRTLEGKPILDLDASTGSVTIPAALHRQVAAWTISRPGSTRSGTTVLAR